MVLYNTTPVSQPIRSLFVAFLKIETLTEPHPVLICGNSVRILTFVTENTTPARYAGDLRLLLL